MNTYTFTHQNITTLLYNTIEMFIEYRDKHEKTEETAAYLAVSEMIQGLDATIELVHNGELSKDNAGMVIE